MDKMNLYILEVELRIDLDDFREERWFLDEKFHRTNGPAITWIYGHFARGLEFYLYGREVK